MEMSLKELEIIIEAKIKANQFSSQKKGVVTGVSGSTVTVQLVGDVNEISDIINKSGEVLSIGDRVLIEAIGGNFGNSFIRLRFEPNIVVLPSS